MPFILRGVCCGRKQLRLRLPPFIVGVVVAALVVIAICLHLHASRKSPQLSTYSMRGLQKLVGVFVSDEKMTKNKTKENQVFHTSVHVFVCAHSQDLLTWQYVCRTCLP